MADERRLLATQRDCWVVSYDDIDPTKYVPHKMATAAYARERSIYHKEADDNQLVRREDLKYKYGNIENIKNWEEEATFISEEFDSDSRSYVDRRLRYPEQKGNEDVQTAYALPNTEILISKVQGDDVGRVELKTSGNSSDMWVKITTPDGLVGEKQCQYEVYSRGGEFKFNVYFHLKYKKTGFPIKFYFTWQNDTEENGISVNFTKHGKYYDLTPLGQGSADFNMDAIDLITVHEDQTIGVPIHFSMQSTCTCKWSLDSSEEYSDIYNSPAGQSGSFNSFLRFASDAKMREMYEAYKAGVEVYMELNVTITN